MCRRASSHFPTNKTGGKWGRTWRLVRLKVGGGRWRADMLATVDFAAASSGAIMMVFPTARIGWRYFHLSQSLRRGVQRLGPHGKYEME